MLLCLGLVSAVVATWGTASVILCLVVVSCALRASGEHRADRSMAGLREPAPERARPGGRRTRRRRSAAPALPLGPLLGMTALPAFYYVLLAAVLTLYATALTAARRVVGCPG